MKFYAGMLTGTALGFQTRRSPLISALPGTFVKNPTIAPQSFYILITRAGPRTGMKRCSDVVIFRCEIGVFVLGLRILVLLHATTIGIYLRDWCSTFLRIVLIVQGCKLVQLALEGKVHLSWNKHGR